MLPKRFKYFVSSILGALSFFLFINLPFDSRYYGIMVGIVFIIFCFWFGLGIIFDESVYNRVMSILLPVGFFLGFGLFTVLLPLNAWMSLLFSVLFGGILYIIFLVENVFMVAIGYRTVPLYRAAYTVSLIILLITSFFLFNSLYSFKLIYWANLLAVFLISLLIFSYQFWAVAIELPDDGASKDKLTYIFIPSLLMAQLGLVFSFWPVGIFRGSIYLVLVIYILSGLIHADIRDRFYKKTWMTFSWIGIAMLLGIIVMTNWR